MGLQHEQPSIIRFLGSQQARYPLFFAFGLFIFAQLLTHDGAIYSDVETGRSDVNALNQLYFDQWNHEENTQLLRGMLIGVALLVGYGIAIRLAQRKA